MNRNILKVEAAVNPSTTEPYTVDDNPYENEDYEYLLFNLEIKDMNTLLVADGVEVKVSDLKPGQRINDDKGLCGYTFLRVVEVTTCGEDEAKMLSVEDALKDRQPEMLAHFTFDNTLVILPASIDTEESIKLKAVWESGEDILEYLGNKYSDRKEEISSFEFKGSFTDDKTGAEFYLLEDGRLIANTLSLNNNKASFDQLNETEQKHAKALFRVLTNAVKAFSVRENAYALVIRFNNSDDTLLGIVYLDPTGQIMSEPVYYVPEYTLMGVRSNIKYDVVQRLHKESGVIDYIDVDSVLKARKNRTVQASKVLDRLEKKMKNSKLKKLLLKSKVDFEEVYDNIYV